MTEQHLSNIHNPWKSDYPERARSSTSGVLLRDLMHPMRFVPETMAAHELLNLFLDERFHMAAVADEYGGFEGVVTLEDVLECLLGKEIVDEHDQIDDMQVHARKQAEQRDPSV